MELYLNKAEVCERIGLHKQTLYEWMRSGLFFEPDVSVGIDTGRIAEGYTEERVILYGQMVNLLDTDGQRIPAGLGVIRRRPNFDDAPFPSWWHADTRHYLGKPDLARLWGVKFGAIETRAHRRHMPEAAVAIGAYAAKRVYGYTRADAESFARQIGKKVVSV